MATTGKPGETVSCKTCGAPTIIGEDGFSRPHKHGRAKIDPETGKVKTCLG